MLSFYWLGLKKIFNFGKKVLLILLVYFTVISLFFYFINKDKPKITYDPIKKNREEIYKVINDPQFNKTTEGKTIIASYRMILCGMIGEACTNNPDDGDKNFNHSLFGFVSNLLVLPYANPPASGVYWAYSGLQNAGFVPKTYAAEGIGFSAIRPLIEVWKIFRNLSYLFLVLVLISIGFMIMFRAKINPQTVISIENSIPKIVITLLLITFSFPIVGFVIDLMYVLISFTIALLEPGKLVEEFNDVVTGGSRKLINEIFFSFQFGAAASGLIDIFPTSIRIIINLITAALSVYLFNFLFLGKLAGVKQVFMGIPVYGNLIGQIVETLLLIILVPILSPVLIAFLFLLTAAFFYFRIFILLLTNYIELLIYIIFSPLILIFESFPGKSVFSFWFKKIFFSIFVFYFVFALIKVVQFTGSIIIPSNSGQLWQPPFLSSFGYENFTSFISLGFLLIIPDIIKFLKQAFGIKDIGIGFNLGTFFGSVGTIWSGAQLGLGLYSSFSQMPIIGRKIQGFMQKRGWVAPDLSQEYLEILARKADSAQVDSIRKKYNL